MLRIKSGFRFFWRNSVNSLKTKKGAKQICSSSSYIVDKIYWHLIEYKLICDNKNLLNPFSQIMYNRSPWPQTVNAAAEQIISIMSDKEKKKVSSVPEGKLQKLRFSLGRYINNELGLLEGNDALMKACAISEHGYFESHFFINDADSASDVILEAIWNRLNYNNA